MTPAARIQAAIGILDRFIDGAPAEQVLTGWARRSRYAGSKDRAAVRDHVFEAIRRLRSDAALGGARTGRGLMLGALRRAGVDPQTVFTGSSYAPAELDEIERDAGLPFSEQAERLDIPDWLWLQFASSQGDDTERAATSLQSRAQVYLRVNLIKSDREGAMRALARDGIACALHPGSRTALLVLEGSRRIRQSAAYLDGLVELQDAASQAVVEALPLRDGMRVLDYCAGGGGKALAMAAQARIKLFVHDVSPERMRDLPTRAARAGVKATPVDSADLVNAAPFDVVLCDAPCSGSGAWRRSPEGKWTLTQDRLDALTTMQGEILRSASGLVLPAGILAYATCSVLSVENESRVLGFLRDHQEWRVSWQQGWSLLENADGFFSAHLTRE
jgi:16S rRNA (cytosine967-C5)-methyltransferase